MGASFRNVGEIEALAGCDRLTISPALLDTLSAARARCREGSRRRAPTAPPRPPLDEKTFRFALNEDAMASDKLAEGIRAFAKDLRKLRALVSRRLEAAKAA